MKETVSFDLVSWRIGPDGFTSKWHITEPDARGTLCGRQLLVGARVRRNHATVQTAINPDTLCRECLMLLATRPRDETWVGCQGPDE